jgi:hypothetical protein
VDCCIASYGLVQASREGSGLHTRTAAKQCLDIVCLTDCAREVQMVEECERELSAGRGGGASKVLRSVSVESFILLLSRLPCHVLPLSLK